MEITVNIHGLDSLAQAIAAMAQAIERGQGGASTVAAASAPAPATEATASAASAPTASEPIAPAAPAAPAPAVPLATAPQQYTLAELQKAVMPLLDAGRVPELQQVLAKYGAQDLTRVPAEQYGALAADFRALGARL